MKNNRIKCETLILLFLASGILCSRSETAEALPQTSNAEALKLITDYKRWKPANESPLLMLSTLAPTDCRAPTETEKRRDDNDMHKDKFITVYVNALGYAEFATKRNPRFPEGTIVVKEKFPTKTSSNPELLTVMVKRRHGFDPKNGDWEYLTFNGPATKLTSNGKMQHCQECHEDRRSEDYVFRNYMSPNIYKALK